MKPLLRYNLLPALLAAALAGLPSLPAHAQALPANNVDTIVAVVNEDVILRSELDRAIANVMRQFASQPGNLPPREVLERQVLERLVIMRLQVSRAGESGIRISDQELQQAINQIATQNKLSPDQLRERLAADGLSFAEFQNNLRDEVTVQRLRQRYVQSSVQVSEAEVDQLLATRPAGTSEVRLANLVIGVAEGATPDEVAAAKAKIDGIRAQIERGEIDFRSAAIRYSQAQNALDGGEIGWRSLDAVPPAFAEMLRALQPGQMTQVVRGSNGFQIVQLEETRDQQAPQSATQFHAQDILVLTTDVVGVEQARQKAEQLRARVVAGEDFAKVASEASDDTQTRAKGGDMGWFPLEAWGTAVATQLQQLADNEVSPVFQSEVGFHIIKRLGTREQDVTTENRRAQARETIGQRKADEAYERFLRQLRSEAYVEVRLGGA
jgi:peptidyl-prolyl cis-trans isomerase SurA